MQTRLYTADPLTFVRITPLDGLTAIYHRPSGMTHIVGDPVPQILAVLRASPLTTAALLAALARDHDLISDDDAHMALQQRLDELCASGLVRLI